MDAGSDTAGSGQHAGHRRHLVRHVLDMTAERSSTPAAKQTPNQTSAQPFTTQSAPKNEINDDRQPGDRGHLLESLGGFMRSRMLATATAFTVAIGGLTVLAASGAQAAKPEPLAVVVQATAGTTAGTVSYSFSVNTAARQLSSVSVTVSVNAATASLPTPALQSPTAKTTTGSGSLSGLPANTYTFNVTATTKKGETATDSASVVVAGETRQVDVAGAKTWCTSVSGTWEEGGTYFLGWKDPELTQPDYAQNAVWACLDANSDWTFPVDTAGNSEFQASIQSAYCTEIPFNAAAYPTLHVGIDPVNGDTTVENFICYRISAT